MKLTERKLRSIIREELKRESLSAQLYTYSVDEGELMQFYDALEQLGVNRTDEGRFAFLKLNDVTARVTDVKQDGGSFEVTFTPGSNKMPGTVNTSQTVSASSPSKAAKKVRTVMKRNSYE